MALVFEQSEDAQDIPFSVVYNMSLNTNFSDLNLTTQKSSLKIIVAIPIYNLHMEFVCHQHVNYSKLNYPTVKLVNLAI